MGQIRKTGKTFMDTARERKAKFFVAINWEISMMDNFITDFILGVVAGTLLGICIGFVITLLKIENSYLDPCEAELARNQHFKLIAVPVGEQL